MANHYLYEGLSALGGRGRAGLIQRALRKNYELMTKRKEVELGLEEAKQKALADVISAHVGAGATISAAELGKEGTLGAAGEYARGYIGAARERKLGTIEAARLQAEAAKYGADIGAESTLAVTREEREGALDVAKTTTEADLRKTLAIMLGRGDITLRDIARVFSGQMPEERL